MPGFSIIPNLKSIIFIGKPRTAFREINPQLIRTISLIIEGKWTKNLETSTLFSDFSKAFNSIQKWKIKQVEIAYGLSSLYSYIYDDDLQKYESNVSSTWWWHQPFSRSLARKIHWHHIFIHNLPWLRIMNVNKSNKGK